MSTKIGPTPRFASLGFAWTRPLGEDRHAPQTQVRRRIDRLLTELIAIAPPGRRESLQARLQRIRDA